MTNEEKKQHIINRLKAGNGSGDGIGSIVAQIRKHYHAIQALNEALIGIVGSVEAAEQNIPHDGEQWRLAFTADTLQEGVDWVGFALDRLPESLGGMSRTELYQRATDRLKGDE